MLVSSDHCERNKGPILEVLRQAFAARHAVLEIGSGTGQHAVHFAAHLPQLIWQPSELAALLPPLAERVRLEGSANLRQPIALDVRAAHWPHTGADAIFSANTLHIIGPEAVEDFFRGAGAALADNGVLCAYGPFNYQGHYTSDSNAQFDAWLKARDPRSAIRDFEFVDGLARAQGLTLAADHAMPANNRTLVWRRPPRT
jgi:cyclopropane fatty-acyl-phospholipid synthase-like methyltransferase